MLLALPWQGTRYTDGGLFVPMELSAGLLLVSVLPLSSAQKMNWIDCGRVGVPLARCGDTISFDFLSFFM